MNGIGLQPEHSQKPKMSPPLVIYKMKKKVTGGKAIDVFFILESSDVPAGLAFVPDKKDKNHYLLTVTEKMKVDDLVTKLLWVADRLTPIRDAIK